MAGFMTSSGSLLSAGTAFKINVDVCISNDEGLNRILVSLLCLGKKTHVVLIQPFEELQPAHVWHVLGHLHRLQGRRGSRVMASGVDRDPCSPGSNEEKQGLP